jgi:hypothetical protein
MHGGSVLTSKFTLMKFLATLIVMNVSGSLGEEGEETLP